MARRKSNGSGTIFKQGSVYHLQYSVDGKRRKKSLKTGNEREAQKRARDILQSVNGTKEMTDIIKTAAFDKGIVNKEQIDKISEIVDRTSKKTVLITEAWDCYLESPNRPDSGASTLTEYHRYWKRFVKWVEDNMDKNVAMHEITLQESREYAQHLQEKPKLEEKKKLIMGAGTYNKYIRFCKLCFKTLAYDAGLTINPFDGIALKHNNEDNSKRELTREELTNIENAIEEGKQNELKFIADSSKPVLAYKYRKEIDFKKLKNPELKATEFCTQKWDEVKLLFSIGVFTGLRLKDACLLKWDQVKLARDLISLPPAKLKRKGKSKWIQLPIIPVLKSELKNAADWMDGEYVLPIIARQYNADRSAPQKLCKKIFEDAGIKTTLKQDDETRAVTVVGFHSLRHTFVSECAKNGVPLAVVQALVGHGSPAMTRHYTHIDIDTAREGIAKIGLKDQLSDSEKLLQIKNLVSDKKSDDLESLKKKILEIVS